MFVILRSGCFYCPQLADKEIDSQRVNNLPEAMWPMKGEVDALI